MTQVIDFKIASERLKMERLAKILEKDLTNIKEDERLEAFSVSWAMTVVTDILAFLDDDYDLESNPKLIFEIIALVEVLRSMIYRIHGIEFEPLQGYLEEIYEIEDPAQTLSDMLDELLGE